ETLKFQASLNAIIAALGDLGAPPPEIAQALQRSAERLDGLSAPLHPEIEVGIHFTVAQALEAIGEGDLALEAARRTVARARELGVGGVELGAPLAMVASLTLTQGRPAEAIEPAREALELISEAGSGGAIARLLLLRA